MADTKRHISHTIPGAESRCLRAPVFLGALAGETEFDAIALTLHIEFLRLFRYYCCAYL